MNTFRLRNKHLKNYFEGWYVRLLSDSNNIAVIFGITYYNKDPHAFIQYKDNKHNKHFRFDLDEVTASESSISIGDNYLTTNSLNIQLDGIEHIDIVFDNLTPLNKGLINNSIMSILYYLPLECYQEVVYLKGTYQNDKTEGKLYIEKTYGRKFPKEWIWIQSDYPISFAAAKMPLLFNKYGFYCLFEFNDKQYIFSSYKLGRVKIRKQDNIVNIQIKQRKYLLELKLEQKNTFKLIGPSDNGQMNITVNESLDSLLELKFYHNEQLLTESSMKNVACEVEKK